MWDFSDKMKKIKIYAASQYDRLERKKQKYFVFASP